MAFDTSLKVGAGVAVVLLAVILAVCVVTVVEVFEIKAEQLELSAGSWPHHPEFPLIPNLSTESSSAPSVTVSTTRSTTSTTLPPTPPSLPNTNINPPTHSSKYEQVAAMFRIRIDTSVNPCEDFYKYACGRYDLNDAFVSTFYKNRDQLIAAYESSNTNDLLPVKQLKLFYKKCVAANEKGSQVVADNALLKNKMKQFLQLTKTSFPLFGGKVLSWPDPATLSLILGTLSAKFNVQFLIYPMVTWNTYEPRESQPYVFALYDGDLTFPLYEYSEKNWNTTKQKLTLIAVKLFEAYADLLQKPLDKPQLTRAAEEIVEFEHFLVTHSSSSESNFTLLKDFLHGYPFLHWPTYVHSLTELNDAEVRTRMLNSSSKIVLSEPQKLSDLNKLFLNEFSGTGVKPSTLYNYLAFRLLFQHKNYFPTKIDIPNKRTKSRMASFVPSRNLESESEDANATCFEMINSFMQTAEERVFLDLKYPEKAARNSLQASVRHVVENVLVGAKSMINQLSWLTPGSKASAYSKLENMVALIAYPQLLTDDRFIQQKYGDLSLTPNQSYFVMLDALAAFATKTNFAYLTESGDLEQRYWSRSSVVNAWYFASQNSITFPLAILSPPFFDPNWPASVIFGALGWVIGHEIGHGLDPNGVQYDALGRREPWLDAFSQTNFRNMTECVEEQYSKFCPLDPAVSSFACVNTTKTLSENTADHLGIRAAFRAYRNVIDVNGLESRSSEELVGQFTHDQLFFLASANLWCRKTPKTAEMEEMIQTDTHPPGMFRVQGSIQNFPAFRNAFNCPVGSNSAPEKHCNVWSG